MIRNVQQSRGDLAVDRRRQYPHRQILGRMVAYLAPTRELAAQGGAAIHPDMLVPLLVMALGYGLFTSFVILLRMTTLLLARKIERQREREEYA